MTVAAVIELLANVVKLGISPPVQQLLTSWFAKVLGIPEDSLAAAIQNAKDPPPIRGGDGHA